MMSDEELKHSTTSWIPKKNLSKRLEKLPDISSDLDTTDSEREYEDEDEDEYEDQSEFTEQELTYYKYVTGYGCFLNLNQVIKFFIKLQKCYDNKHKVKLALKMNHNSFLQLINKSETMYFKNLLKNISSNIRIYWTLENEFFLGFAIAENNLINKTPFKMEKINNSIEKFNAIQVQLKSIIKKTLKPTLTTFSCWW
jgi:hypothetical protein